MTVRVKTLNITQPGGVHKIKGSPDQPITLGKLLMRSELVDSGGHYGYPDFPPDRDVGGDFFVRTWKKVFPSIHVGKIVRPGAPLEETYEGIMVPDLGANLGFVGGKLADPTSWGATAYKRMNPAQPDFSALNSIYELREIPEMLRQRFNPFRLKGWGDFHLAIQFGWLALLRDCRNFVKTQRSAQDTLKQLLRDNGRPVRRKILLENVDLGSFTSLGAPVSGFQPILATQFYQGSRTKYFQKDYRRTWASAQFRYWLPEGPRDVLWTAKMLGRIYGFNPTPSVIYNAIPWSWLVDWFSNVGDVIENIDAGVADRLAADYFYVMQERGAYNTLESSGKFMRYGSGQIFEVSGTAFTQWAHKVRVKGDPFGLHTSQNSLTGMQLSILGALGISKLF